MGNESTRPVAWARRDSRLQECCRQEGNVLHPLLVTELREDDDDNAIELEPGLADNRVVLGGMCWVSKTTRISDKFECAECSHLKMSESVLVVCIKGGIVWRNQVVVFPYDELQINVSLARYNCTGTGQVQDVIMRLGGLLDNDERVFRLCITLTNDKGMMRLDSAQTSTAMMSLLTVRRSVQTQERVKQPILVAPESGEEHQKGQPVEPRAQPMHASLLVESVCMGEGTATTHFAGSRGSGRFKLQPIQCAPTPTGTVTVQPRLLESKSQQARTATHALGSSAVAGIPIQQQMALSQLEQCQQCESGEEDGEDGENGQPSKVHRDDTIARRQSIELA